jgi:TM2 domain-containing membrane protein YozV
MNSIVCPACGATTNSGQKCEYCGAVLPQSTINEVKNAMTGFVNSVQDRKTVSDTLQEEDGTLIFLLAIFLGGFGVHQFYSKNNKKGIIYLLCCTVGAGIVIPLILAYIWILMDAWKIAKGEFYSFDKTLHYSGKSWMRALFYISIGFVGLIAIGLLITIFE